jgi:hypothetical protein
MVVGHPAFPGFARSCSRSAIANLTCPDPNVANAMVPHAYYVQGGALTETYVNGSYPNTASWTSQTLAGNPETGSALVATSQSTAGTPYADVFFFGAGGAPSEATNSSGSWTSSRLGGPAASMPGSLGWPMSAASGRSCRPSTRTASPRAPR